MSPGLYSVSVVLDRSFGERLRELTPRGPVWIVDTPENRSAAEKLWKNAPSRSHLDGITVFTAWTNRASEQVLVDEMDMIDLHHGAYSAHPPYTAIRVIGASATAEVRAKLAEFGFDLFRPTDSGFEATRTLEAAEEE